MAKAKIIPKVCVQNAKKRMYNGIKPKQILKVDEKRAAFLLTKGFKIVKAKLTPEEVAEQEALRLQEEAEAKEAGEALENAQFEAEEAKEKAVTLQAKLDEAHTAAKEAGEAKKAAEQKAKDDAKIAADKLKEAIAEGKK